MVGINVALSYIKVTDLEVIKSLIIEVPLLATVKV
jgi:hypothetical protein